MGRDKETFRDIADTTEVTSNFIQGKQVWTPTTNGWRIAQPRRINPNRISAVNLMQFSLTQKLTRLTASNPDIEPAPEFRRVEYKDKIRKAAAVWNGYERKFYKPWFNHQEALQDCISGTYIESVQYDHLSAGAKVFQEIWGKKEVPIVEGSGQCFNCGLKHGDDAFLQEEQMPRCPECGSFDINVTPSLSQMMSVVTGMQPLITGDLTLKLIPIQASRFDVRVRPEESTWFIERMRMSINKLEMILGTNLNFGEVDISDDRGLQSLDSIQRAGNTLFGQDNAVTSSLGKKETVIDRVSVKPEDYRHIRPPKTEPTVSGEEVPAGKSLAEIAPDGLTFLKIGKNLIGVYPNVHHSQEVKSGVYHMRMGSGFGRGSEDEVEVQKVFNRNNAQMVKAGEIGATPAHWFVEGAVDRKWVKSIGKPDSAIPIKREILSELGNRDPVGQFPVGAIAGTFFEYTYNLLDKYRQMVSQTPNFDNGLTGANRSGTATEAKISDSNAEALYSPALEIKADVRCGIADLTLKAYHRHFQGVSKFFAFGTTKQDMAVGEQIKGDDVDCEIEFVVVKDSIRPKTRYSQQSGLAAASQICANFGGIDVLKEQHPNLLHNILQTFDVDIDVDDYDTMEDLCWQRLQQAVQAAGQDPTMILMSIKPLITPFELEHQQKAIWLAEYLDSPEGVKMEEPQRQSIFALIEAHKNGGVYQMGAIIAAGNEAQAIGNQPLVDQQNEQNEMANQSQEASARAQFDREQQGKAAEAGNQAVATEQDRDFQREQIGAQQQLEREKMDNQAQLEREKMANAGTAS